MPFILYINTNGFSFHAFCIHVMQFKIFLFNICHFTGCHRVFVKPIIIQMDSPSANSKELS